MATPSGENFQAKGNFSKESNPCFKEQMISYDCLSSRDYDGTKCRIEFENYKACRNFWNQIRLERVKKGLEPYIPPEEERKKILEERFPGKKSV